MGAAIQTQGGRLFNTFKRRAALLLLALQSVECRAAFAPIRKLPAIPSYPSTPTSHQQHAPTTCQFDLRFSSCRPLFLPLVSPRRLDDDSSPSSESPDDPILRRIKARGARRRILARRGRQSLPEWFRRLLVSSKFSNVFRLSNQDQEDEKEHEGDVSDDKEKVSSTRLPGSRVLKLLLATPLVEFKLDLLVLLSSVFVAAGTVSSIPGSVHAIIDFGENVIAFIFLVEYLLRWYCNGLRASHLIKPLVIVDFLSILPLFAQRISLSFFGGRVLRDNLLVNLRLLRLLRLQRFLVDFKTFERFQQAVGISFGTKIRRYHLQLARIILTIFTMSTVSAGLIYAAEWQVNPTLKDFPSAMYFVITTITTCGFGDICPQTGVGRMIVCAMIFVSAAIIPLQVSQFLEALLDFRRDMEEKKLPGKHKKEEDDADFEKAYELTDVMQPDGSYKKVKTNKLLECQVCNAKPHGKKATFCWSCGSPLWAVRANYLAEQSEKSSEDDSGSGSDTNASPAAAL